jgi:hypothetical protein
MPSSNSINCKESSLTPVGKSQKRSTSLGRATKRVRSQKLKLKESRLSVLRMPGTKRRLNR